MVENVVEMSLDLASFPDAEAPLITQYDNVKLVVAVTDEGVPFDLTNIETATIVTSRSDGAVVVEKGEVISDRLVFYLNRKSTGSAGTAKIVIQLYDNMQNRVSTLFGVLVVREDLSSSTTPVGDEYTLIQEVLRQGPAVIEAAQTASKDLIDKYNELVKEGVISTEIANKLLSLEQNYAPKLTEVNAQLAQTELVKLGGGVKAQPEDLSAETLGLVTGTGGPINLLSVPQDDSVTKEKMAGLITTQNIYNKKTVLQNATSSETGINTVQGWTTSQLIPVTHPSTITISHAEGLFVSLHKADGSYLFRWSVQLFQSPHSFDTIAETAFVRFNVKNEYVDVFMAVVGATLPTNYQVYKNEIPWLTLKNGSIDGDALAPEIKNSLTSKWLDKKIVTFGDSITWYDGHAFQSSHIQSGTIAKGYQSYMREKLGAVVDNQGYDGAHSKLIVESKVKGYTDYSGVDAVTFTCGANDHRLGFPLGVLQSVGTTHDTNTFTGAIQDGIEYMLTQKPDLKIYLITPIKGWFTAEVGNRYKGENIISLDYVNRLKEIADFYSLPILDWYHLSGINDLNYRVNGQPYYIGDNPAVWTAYQLHPTNDGYGRMANVLIPFLNNY